MKVRDRKDYSTSNGLVLKARNNGTYVTYVPTPLDEEVISFCHTAQGHPGVNKLLQLIRRKYFIKDLEKKASTICRLCMNCTINKPKTRISHLPPPNPDPENQPWNKFYIDLYDMHFQDYKGFRYILTITDSLSHFVDGEPIANKQSETVAVALLNLILRHNCMHGRMISDSGLEFRNALNKRITQLFGIQHSRIAPYSPQGNIDERRHKEIGIKFKQIGAEQDSWSDYWGLVRYTVNNMPHIECDGLSPSELLTGRPLFFPVHEEQAPEVVMNDPMVWYDYVSKWVKTTGADLEHAAQERHANPSTEQPFTFKRNEKCVAWHPLRPGQSQKLYSHYQGPYIIVKRLTPVTYILKHLETNRKICRHIRHLRKLK